MLKATIVDCWDYKNKMPKSKVVLVKSKSLFSNGKPDSTTIESMLSRGISLLSDGTEANAVWKKIARDTGRIGMKLNCLAGKKMSTSVELTMALVNLLRAAGKNENDMIVWERYNRELQSAGYELNIGRNGLKCFGTDTRDVGYGYMFHTKGKVGSLVSKIVESECDHLINIPILKDHSLAGVSGGMKNYFGAVHNPNKYHDNNCDPYVAEVNALPVIRDKNILTVMDMTRIQYHAGPGYRPEYVVRFGGVMMSRDPVAIDAVGAKIIDEYRVRNKMKTLEETGRPPRWLKTAEKLGLGNADPDNIDLIEIKLD